MSIESPPWSSVHAIVLEKIERNGMHRARAPLKRNATSHYQSAIFDYATRDGLIFPDRSEIELRLGREGQRADARVFLRGSAGREGGTHAGWEKLHMFFDRYPRRIALKGKVTAATSSSVMNLVVVCSPVQSRISDGS